MITYHYSVCGLDLRIDTPREMWIEPFSEAFLTDGGKGDVVLQFNTAEEISLPEGLRCSADREKPVWRDGKRVFRGDWDLFRAKMHFCTDYLLDKPSEMRCTVREEDWHWATRSKYLWPGIMLNYILLHHRALMFHASYVAHEGGGILFIASSGVGKSTQAELWRKYRGARVINGDKAAVRLEGMAMAHGVPISGSSGICENLSLPLKAVVVLSQAPENSVRRLPPSQAVQALFPNVFVDNAVPEEWQMALELLLDLVSAVPVYALACTPDERAVEALEKAMKEDSI